MRNIEIIRNFICAWSRLDPNELADFFTDGGSYHNMPTQPVSGHDDLRNFISGFLSGWEKTDWEILHLLAAGDIVMVERIDRTVAGGKTVELPCFGIFEMKEGKLAVWRDYFDMSTYISGLS